EGEIALVSTTWQGGPSVGANETLTVGTSRTENTGGTEPQDDWSSQGAAADPDQPLVIGTLHNPDAADATSELAESAVPPAEAPTASPRLMEAVAQGEHVAPAETDPSEALAAGEGPVEPEPAVDVFLRPKGIPGESKDVPPPDEGSDELSAPVPDDDAPVPYLRYELKNTMVSSYNLDDDDGGPSTLVDLGDTGAIEDTAQYAEPDL